MAVPNDRCGFELTPERVIERAGIAEGTKQLLIEMDPKEWHRLYNISCCWRHVWNDTDWCIWHAEVDEKPIASLVTARSNDSEGAVFEGVFLQGFELRDRISFRKCRLISADLSDADLSRANLSDAWLSPIRPVR